MQNFYQNAPTPNTQPIYDQFGNVIGYMPSAIQTAPSSRIGTPEWWPRTQQAQQSIQQQATQQQATQQPQAPAMQGKWVKGENEIVPMDIPQDGSVVVFPQTDLQVIYLKKWEGNGTITTVPYIPNVPQNSEPKVDPMQQFQENVQGRLTNIERALDALINTVCQPVQTTTNVRSKNSSKEDAK